LSVDRLSSLDLSFLALESTDTPMHLGAVLTFRPGAGRGGDEPDGELAGRLVAVLMARVAGVPRLRRRLSNVGFGLGGPAWIDDPGFDPAAHVRLGALTAPGGRGELALRVAELLAVPLDRGRPMWELHVLSGLGDGSVAVLAKVHQALADGLRAVLLALALFDDPAAAGIGRPVPSAAQATPDPGLTRGTAARLGRAAAGLLAPTRALLSPARALDPRAVGGGLARNAGQARDAAAIGASIVAAVARPAPACLTLNPAAARRFATLNTAAKGPVQRFAMADLDLDAVRRVSKTHGGTVTDVLLTVLTGGLRSWLAERGHRQPRPLRALVPVSRPHPDPGGNRLSGYLVELPVDDPDPLRRLARVREAMRANQAAGPNRGPGAFPLLAEWTPRLLHRLAAPIVAPLTAPTARRLFNTVITHVTLPTTQLTLAGAKLDEIYPVLPLAAGQGLGIAISTHHCVAHLGLRANHTAIPDLHRITHHLNPALDDLCQLPAPAHQQLTIPHTDRPGPTVTRIRADLADDRL